ncbi:MAG: stage II sporulation protein R [Angelakisella sp.]|nr:stage II sporulation protein R [Angelakisella sp.]
MDRYSKIDSALIIGLMMALIVSSIMAFGSRCEEIRGQVLRLHVLANSNSKADQELKLGVRDAVLDATGDLFAAAGNLTEAEDAAKTNLALIRQTAQEEIIRRGSNDPVDVKLTRMFFETRVYENATLPAGYYDAVRITIGEAKGKNWWCVMFPPMCVQSAVKQTEDTQLTKEIQQLGERPDYKMAFAAVELFESLRDKLTQAQEQVIA